MDTSLPGSATLHPLACVTENVRAITRIPGLKAKEDKKARNHAGVSIGFDM